MAASLLQFHYALVSSVVGVVRLPSWQEVWQANCDKLATSLNFNL